MDRWIGGSSGGSVSEYPVSVKQISVIFGWNSGAMWSSGACGAMNLEQRSMWSSGACGAMWSMEQWRAAGNEAIVQNFMTMV